MNYINQKLREQIQTYRVAGKKDGGRMIFNKMSYYDIETDTRYIGSKAPRAIDYKSVHDYEKALTKYLDDHALNVENTVQIGILTPASAKGIKNALKVASRYELIEIEGVAFYMVFIGELSTAINKYERNQHAKNVITRFAAYRKSLKSCNLFCGFNNHRFDSGILKVLGIEDIEESFTHVKKIDGQSEIDLIRWGRAIGAGSLRKLGDELCKLGYEARKLDDLETQDQALFDSYNRRDVEILAMFVHMFNKQLNIFHHNMPSFVKYVYNEIFAQYGYTTIKTSIFSQYEGIGARCEAYRFKLNDVRVYDFNSLYPSVMALLDYPAIQKYEKNVATGIITLRTVPPRSPDFINFDSRLHALHAKTEGLILIDPRFLREYEKQFGKVFYWLRVRIKAVDEKILHIFPFGYKDDDGTVMFNFNPDITYEIDSYNIRYLAYCDYEIVDMRATPHEPLLLADSVKERYELRKKYKEEDSPLQMLMKIILNAGFGIFGSRGNRTRRTLQKRFINDFNEEKDIILKTLGWQVNSVNVYDHHSNGILTIKNRGELYHTHLRHLPRFNSNSLPSISQTTLSHSRALMYSVIRLIEDNGGKVYYTDTDSLFIDQRGEEVLISTGLVGDKLGQCKLEDVIKEGYALAPKLYNYTNKDGKYKSTSKGVKDPAVMNEIIITDTYDPITVVRRMVARLGGKSKRHYDHAKGIHINRPSIKGRDFSKGLHTALTYHSDKTGVPIDEEIVREWAGVGDEWEVETINS